MEKVANSRFDHEAFGLKPEHKGFQAHPTINDDLPQRMMTGAIKVKPNITHFYEDLVMFSDGTTEELDAVFFATGYEYDVSYVDKSVTHVEDNKTCLYKYVYPPHMKHPTFGMIGMVQAIGAVLPISEMQSRWFAKVIRGDLSLPSEDDMNADIQQKRLEIGKLYYDSPRHTLQTFWIQYMDEIADIIGAKPSMWQLFWNNPALAISCFFGPCVPSQYRLTGPDKRHDAHETVKKAVDSVMRRGKT